MEDLKEEAKAPELKVVAKVVAKAAVSAPASESAKTAAVCMTWRTAGSLWSTRQTDHAGCATRRDMWALTAQ